MKYYIVWGINYQNVQSSVIDIEGNIEDEEDITIIMDKIKEENKVTNLLILNIIKLPI